MHPTFYDDPPMPFDVPPLPLNDDSVGFTNFALQTQKTENLRNFPKQKNEFISPPPKIEPPVPRSTRPPPINPALIRSPRIRDNEIDSGRMILSTGESYIGPSALQNKINQQIRRDDDFDDIEPPRSIRSPVTDRHQKDDLPEALFTAVQMEGDIGDIPLPAPTPARLVQNVRVKTASEEFEQAKWNWKKKIQIEEQKNKEKIQTLIQNHVNELRVFDEKYGKLPRAVTAVPITLELRPNGRNRALARVPVLMQPYNTTHRVYHKPCFTPRQMETSQKRKQIISRQEAELLAVNDECNTRILALKAQMKYDLEKRASELSTLLGKNVAANIDFELMPKSPHEKPGAPFHLKVKKVQSNKKL